MQKSQEILNSSPKNQANKKSILVVDDNAAMLELRKMILQMDGSTVFLAASGAEVLKMLNEVAVDLILEIKQPKILEEVQVVFLTYLRTGLLSKFVEINKRNIMIPAT